MCLVTQSCLTLCNSLDSSLQGSSVHGIFQARIQEWVEISSFMGSSQPRGPTCISCVSCIFCIAGSFWAMGNIYQCKGSSLTGHNCLPTCEAKWKYLFYLKQRQGLITLSKNLRKGRKRSRKGNGNPLQYSCLENPMDRKALRVTIWGVAKSQVWLKWLITHAGNVHLWFT